MALSNVGGGRVLADLNVGEVTFGAQGAPANIAAGNATLTIANLVTGILTGNPGSSAAAYTLPTVALTEATLVNARKDHSFDFSVINVDGSASGVITMTAGTGWTIVGLATIAAVAGTTGRFRARKTGDAAWSLYRLS